MTTTPDSLDAASPLPVWEMLTAYQRSTALYTAIELGVFGAIGKGAGEVGAIARECGASERGIRILCDYLVIAGMLQKVDGVYRHTPTSAMFLDPKSPACLASAARFIAAPALYEGYLRLTEAVRNGRTALAGEGTVEPDNPIWVDFARGMAPMMAPLAGPLASAVLAKRTGKVRVLDVAAGHGLFGIAVAQQNPEAQIIALDWQNVLAVAQENATRAGVGDRYKLLPGSAFDVDYGGPYDVVLLTNFLHHFDVETCTKLLRRVYDASAPGAVVATLEFVPNDDRVTPPPAAAFSMTMLASTVAGDAYTFRELESMYRNAGFVEMTATPIPESAQTIVVGIRPRT